MRLLNAIFGVYFGELQKIFESKKGGVFSLTQQHSTVREMEHLRFGRIFRKVHCPSAKCTHTAILSTKLLGVRLNWTNRVTLKVFRVTG